MILKDKKCLVHTDLGRTLVIAKRAGVKINPKSIQEDCFQFIASHLNGDLDLLSFPAFNYDYGKNRLFDVDADPIQVGNLNEWIRNNKSYQRNQTPIFSFLVKNEPLTQTSDTINPFGSESHFQRLYDEDASVVMFGAKISALTFLHYIEDISGKPLYRYDKNFPGEIKTSDGTTSCQLKMHVRPMGVTIEYDWEKLGLELSKAKILHKSEYSNDLFWMNVRPLVDFLSQRIKDNPFYLLDNATAEVFKKLTKNGTERIILGDFEK